MSKVRNSVSCDGCALRRVRCEAKRPCYECRTRGIECTALRARKKRGPKGGHRGTTKNRIEEFQRRIGQPPLDDGGEPLSSLENSPAVAIRLSGNGSEILANDVDDESCGTGSSIRTTATPSDPSRAFDSAAYPGRLPVEDYCRFLDIFRQKVYPVWPVVNSDDLIAKITLDENDFEAWALAAALCSATIAQLRLPEHTRPRNTVSSLQFCLDSLRFRDLYDYRETHTVPTILTPFFLHIFYANANKLRTAAFYLRECITFVHGMELDHPDRQPGVEARERSLRVRVYWLIFVSERTFSAQNGLPAVLNTIETMPDAEDDVAGDANLMQAFISLTRLFAYLEGNLMETSPALQPIDRNKLAASQADLCMDVHDCASDEAQRVDLFVTRQWIRLLMWEYTARYFTMSCYPEDQAFSLFLPVKIGHEMLSLFSLVNDSAIRAHGYGMELKVFRLADSLLDIIKCAPWSARGDGMLTGSGDVLLSLQRVLLAVGGKDSVFLQKMQQRMSQLELNSGSWPHLALSPPENDQSDQSQSERSSSGSPARYSPHISNEFIQGEVCEVFDD